ncbi:MAG: hypothetical protein WC197_00730 [Candidatus Gastranaerophilaceae bacterium]|jgi:hypothetical protein
MSKKRKLYNLRTGIMCEIEKVMVLLEQITNNDCIERKTSILAEIALEKSERISKMNEKMSFLLKH